MRLRTLAPKKGSGSVSIPYRVSKRTSVSCVFVCSCAATPGIFVPERPGVQPSLHPIPLHIERCWSAGPGANVSDGPSHAKHVKTGRQVGQNTGTYDIVPPGSMLPSAEPSHCARVCVCLSLSLCRSVSNPVSKGFVQLELDSAGDGSACAGLPSTKTPPAMRSVDVPAGRSWMPLCIAGMPPMLMAMGLSRKPQMKRADSRM